MNEFKRSEIRRCSNCGSRFIDKIQSMIISLTEDVFNTAYRCNHCDTENEKLEDMLEVLKVGDIVKLDLRKLQKLKKAEAKKDYMKLLDLDKLEIECFVSTKKEYGGRIKFKGEERLFLDNYFFKEVE
ncbi:MAG: hypothetical protein ACRDAG_01300 [Cetobacterium somerae]|uniref:hypothetical protein n=1 Tax=Cetobacterium somerae TaxID=188913 RepID=UPI003F317148